MEIIHTVAFCAGEGGGNPCPVVLEADSLSTEEMMGIARQFGSECACVLASSQSGCRWQLRYFLPNSELSSCGHATMAAVTVMVQRGLLSGGEATLETAGGLLPITWVEENGKVTVQMEQGLPALGNTADPEEVCRALGITPEQLSSWPIQTASTSRFKLMIPLASRPVLDGLAPDFEALWALCDHIGVSGVYPFAAGESGEYYARQFPCRAGYLEDPATGVAASALNGYLYLNGFLPDSAADGWHSSTIYQGFAMGRPSVLLAQVETQNGKPCRTRICGGAQVTDKPAPAL